ncbi:MAG: radical SAM protein [Nanoarchaeota archaeon]
MNKKTKVLLIKPKSYSLAITPPLGLGYLSGTLKKNGYSVTIIDCDLISKKKLIKEAERLKPDLIGITGMTPDFPEIKNLAKLFRKISPKAKIIVGGIHVSVLPKESFIELKPDFIIIGEGEMTLLDLVNKREINDDNFGEVDGLCFYKDKKIIINKPRKLIKNLDDLKVDWEGLNILKYPSIPQTLIYKKWPFSPFMTSRGCPNNCAYCASSDFWKRKLRFHSPIRVVDDIEHLIKKYNIKEIRFLDDNITLNKSHISEICNEILRRNIKINWCCPNGVQFDTLDETLVKKMSESGCYFCGLGIEFGDAKIRKLANRHFDYSNLKEKIQLLRLHNIITWGFFVLGFPGETKETLIKTYRFSKEVGVDFADFTLFIPIPGSEIYKSLTKSSKKNLDFKNFQFYKPYLLSEHIGINVRKYQKKFMLGYYLRPKTLYLVLTVFIKLRDVFFLPRIFNTIILKK